MPRMKNETSTLLADLQGRIATIVETARREGHDEALASIRSLVGGGARPLGGDNGGFPKPMRGPGRPKGSKNKPKAAATTKSGRARKNPWAGLTAEQKLARVNAIRKGRGLPLKSS